jgi:MFS transporter, DHA1 family, multidrug resistance protein
MMDPNINNAAVFPGNGADGVAVVAAHTDAVRHGWRVLAILSALMGFASISTDPYLPAMPAMGRALLANGGTAEWTISGYLIGFSLGQLFWGPIGDRHGRRLPVAIGLVLFVVGSAGCALADSIWGLIGRRVLQAVGACAGVVLARAMVRDLYPASTITSAVTSSPAQPIATDKCRSDMRQRILGKITESDSCP